MSTVLVADDDERIAHLIEIQLIGAGHSVVLAHDGGTVVELVTAGGIDALVLDIMMPELDGYRVLAALADLPDAPPAIVVSALDRKENRTVAMDAGAYAYLVKPFDLAELTELVRKAIVRAR